MIEIKSVSRGFRVNLEFAIGGVLLLACGLAASAQDWTQWGGSDQRNMVSSARGLPVAIDAPESQPTTDSQPAESQPATSPAAAPRPTGSAQGNVKWRVRLGSQSYGNVTVAGGKVFVGSNNVSRYNPRMTGPAGTLLCFRESDGQFLWQLTAPIIVENGQFNGDLNGVGVCSSPTVEGDRVYLMTNRCELLCVSAEGLAGGNRGPFKEEGQYMAAPAKQTIVEGPDGPIKTVVPGAPIAAAPTDADILWRFDMIDQVKSWPQDASSCSALVHGDYVYVGTSNGVDKTHKHIPSPKAPSLIVVNKTTGELVAVDDAGIGPNVFHGQWSSPSLGYVNGRALIFYGGGNGYVYAFDAQPQPGKDGKPGVLKKVWWCDCNPPEYRQKNGKKLKYHDKAGPSEIIATPVLHDGRLYVAIGQDPNHGHGSGALACIDPTRTGDVSGSGVLWWYKDMDRSLSTVSIVDGLLYVADFKGVVHCLDAQTGKSIWNYETGSNVWGSTFVADGKVYIGNEKGVLTTLKAGAKLEVLAKSELKFPIYSTPIVANGVLYVANQKWLYAVK